MMHICDMINENESDVANIVFEISAINKERVQIVLFYVVFSLDKLLITL